MKNILSITLFALVIAMPFEAYADDLSYQEAHPSYYRFEFSYNRRVLTPVGTYTVVSTDTMPPGGGNWLLKIMGPSGDERSRYFFTPLKSIYALTIPYDYSGTSVVITSPYGNPELIIPIQDSRVCDQNKVCESDTGESSDTCPTDCGAVSQVNTNLTASIATGSNIGINIGLWLMRLGVAAAGGLMFLVARTFDNRRKL